MNNRILIVDDSPAFTRLISHILKGKFECAIARNGLEAFAILRGTFQPDLIICDLMMPEFDGVSFLSELQNSGIYGCIPVIVMTGDSSSLSKSDITEDIQTRILTKPFTPQDLFTAIDELFEPVNVAV